jgi:signal transduction histidine kinase
MEFQFEKWRLEGIIKELTDTFILTARNKGLYLEAKFPPKVLPEIEMDGPKVREMISNLIDNALKYTRRGGVTVKMELAGGSQKSADEEQRIRIIISDTGIGIPKDELPRLFTRFSRGKDISRLHAGGTGLGLYVGKSIVDAHHGKIWAESAGEGKGSKFIVELPLSQEKYKKEKRVEDFIEQI